MTKPLSAIVLETRTCALPGCGKKFRCPPASQKKYCGNPCCQIAARLAREDIEETARRKRMNKFFQAKTKETDPLQKNWDDPQFNPPGGVA